MIRHEIANGHCIICNENVDWLIANLKPFDIIEWITFELASPEV